MPSNRRAFGGLTLGALAILAAGPRGAAAQPQASEVAYPGSRPVTVVVAWAPGGSTDFVARVIAQQLSKELNGNVVVDNRPGASGTIGHASVARARPDGYTLLLGVNSTYAMSRHLFPNRGYDDDKAFIGIGRIAVSPIFLCVNPQLGVRDIAGLVAKAKAAPGKLSYASSGAGSSAHLATELFLRQAGIEIQNVTYRGGAPAVQALMTGEVDAAFVDAVTALPLMADKKIIALGVSTSERNPLAPAVPTIAESGFPGFEATSDFALLAPAGLPEQIVHKLSTALHATMMNPEVLERLRQNSILPTVGSPEEFPTYLTAESTKWGELIRSRHITLE
ncbi:tripartite tricarboxylate transporter substrate binding protein [Roseomonas sp. M0104]|uniref:Tripartite tricarboxylate transporter substrate binding protein n=1 Tax=Teichococcus coralli TaxID=2545983 RepID=A0A845BCC3_9PROT|nr:tripartite tricarboxylate transporter substrate binding protein [Pseudoroseomonas coralli]MXP65233.1 tripartite tricarboxylate transporter substrate binding protein [Pseudoroseomonas coralli]